MPRNQSPIVIDLNILPPEYRPRELPSIFRLLWGLAIVLFVLAIPLAFLGIAERARVRQLSGELEQAQSTLQALRTPAADALGLQQQFSDTLKILEQVEAIYPQIASRRQDWPQVIDALLLYDSQRIRLLETYQDGDDLGVVGLALSRDDVLSYASALDASGTFDQVIIQSMESSEIPFYTPTPTATPTLSGTITISPTLTPGTPTATPTLVPYDEYEMDDFEPKPISLFETQKHNFNPLYDQDLVTFLGKAGRRYCIQAIPQAYGVDTYLEVTAGTANYANDDCLPNDVPLLACGCPESEIEGTLASVVEVQIPQTNDENVLVRVTNRGRFGPEQFYDLRVIEVIGDVYERDDAIPKPIGVGETQARTFYPQGDIDRVTFMAKAGHSYQVKTTDLAPGVDTVISVVVGGVAYRNDDVVSGDASSAVEFQTSVDNMAYINVTNKGVYGVDKSYTLQLVEVGGDEYEPDDYAPKPISLWEEQRHTFYPEGDVDWVEFNVKDGRLYQVQTFSLTIGVDTQIRVYVDDEEYGDDDVSDTDPSSVVVFEADDDGEARVKITNSDQFGPDMAYWIAVIPLEEERPTPTPTPTATPDCRDAFEPDDLSIPLISLGETQLHNFCPSGDVDHVVFNVKSGYMYELKTFNLAVGVDTVLAAIVDGISYDNDDVSSGDPSSSITFTALNDGTASATIWNRERYGADKTYYLALLPYEPEPTLTPTPDPRDACEPDEVEPCHLALGEQQEHNFYPDGDVDYVWFNAKAGNYYELKTFGLALGVDTVLELPLDGTVLVNDDIDGDPSSRLTFQATSTGPLTATIRNQDQYGADKYYSISLQPWSPEPTPTPTSDGRDAYEPDEFEIPRLFLNDAQYHTFHSETDVDYVYIRVDAGRRYSVFTCGDDAWTGGLITTTTPFDPEYLACSALAPGVDTDILVDGDITNCEPASCDNDDVLPGFHNSRVEFEAVSSGTVTVTISNNDLYGPDIYYYLRAHEIGGTVSNLSNSPVQSAHVHRAEAPFWSVAFRPLLKYHQQDSTDVIKFTLLLRMKRGQP